MKKKITPPESIGYNPSLPTLNGIEHDGSELPSLCAPSLLLDWNHTHFTHIGDGYYNSWPSPRREPDEWVCVDRGWHTTSSMLDIEPLLAPSERVNIALTKQCVKRLVELGYSVTLTRSRSVKTTTETVVKVTHQKGQYSPHLRIEKHETNTVTHQSGIWK